MTEAQFREISLRNPVNQTILDRLPTLNLPDAWLVSGCLFQTVWNVLTERPLEHGIKDYDVFYFDPDTSWEAEDLVISRGQALFSDLGVQIEFRNQARVHLWYGEKHGRPYPPLMSSCEGIDRFLATANMVGINPEGAVYAPGLTDMAALHIRPNRTANFRKDRYDEKNARYRTCWPELIIEAA